MCGITGWVDFRRDLRPERSVIEAMTSTMVNRGPDAGGVWCSVHAAIGHRRLSVIDLEGGEQPMRAALRGSLNAEPQAEDENQVVLTFSGEVYNFTELRTELTSLGHQFRTRFMAIQPSSTAPVAFMLDINRWLERSGVTIQLPA